MTKKGGKNILNFTENDFIKIISSLPNIFYLLNEKRELVFWNKNAEKITGYSSKELDRMRVMKLFSKKDLSKIIKVVSNYFKDKDKELNIQIVAKNGNKILTKFTWKRIVINKSRYIYGVGIDITKEYYKNLLTIENEEKLFKSNALYESLVENSPNCIKLFDTKGRMIFINKGGKDEHFIKTKQDLKNFDAIKTVILKDRSQMKKAFEDALNGKVASVEVKHIKDKSNREVCRETYLPVKDNKGNIVYIYGVSVDLSEIASKKKEILEKQKNYQKLIDSISMPVMVHTQGIIVYANKAAVTTLKAKNVNQLLNTKIINYVHKDSVKLALQRINSLNEEKDSVGLVEEKLKRLDGKIIIAEVLASTLNYNGKKSVQVIFKDITEKKDNEKKIQEKNEDLEKINHLLIGREMKMIELKQEIKKLSNVKNN